MERSDVDLLAAYAGERDEDAFRELMGRHGGMVFATAVRSLGDAGMAEEVVQNVFTALAMKAGKMAGVRSVAGWLYRSARLEVAMVVRRERRRRVREARAAVMGEVGGGVDTGVGGALDEAMDGLSAGDQRVVVMRFYEGLSVGEVAERLGVGEGAARKRVERAVGRLRKGILAGGGVLVAGGVQAADFVAGAEGVDLGRMGGEVLGRVAAAKGVGLLGFVPWGGVGVGVVVTGVVVAMQGEGEMPSAAVADGVGAAERAVAEGVRVLAVDDLEGIYQLADGEREEALVRLEDYLAGVDDGGYLAGLFARWSRLDGGRSAKVAVGLAGERERVFLEVARRAVERWVQREEVVAVEWVRGYDAERGYEDEVGNAIGEAMVGVLGGRDAERAFEVVQGLRVTTGAMFHSVVEAVALRGYDLEQTVGWLEGLAEVGEGDVVFEIEHNEGEVNFPHVLPEAGERSVDQGRGVVVYPLEAGARKWQVGEGLLMRLMPGDEMGVVERLVGMGLRRAEWQVVEVLMEADLVEGLEWYLDRREAMGSEVGSKVLRKLREVGWAEGALEDALQ